MPRRGNDSGDRELNDHSTDAQDMIATEVGSCLVHKLLRFPGIFLSLFGFGGSIFGGNLFSLSFLNRWLHLGKFKWILNFGLLFIGLIGLAFIWCSFPSARARIKNACCGKCIKRKKQYDRLVEAAETGEVAS